MFQCRLLIDRPATGAWNMAVDEALLIDASENNVATLRFYSWNEPTLSLGYFQRYSDREQHAPSRSCAIVRRQTGGGAILHDRELTYSLALPASHSFAKQNEKLYHAVHQVFINTLSTLNPQDASPGKLQIRGPNPDYPDAGSQTAEEPFLCFQRRSPGDVVLETSGDRPDAIATPINPLHQPWKVLGSAQRRYHGAVLQHGSLLLERSPAAPELAGLSDLVHLTVASDETVAAVCARLADELALELNEDRLLPELESKAAELANIKYGSLSWTKRR